ncbi:MAG: nucleoside hydrolase [bacterium]
MKLVPKRPNNGKNKRGNPAGVWSGGAMRCLALAVVAAAAAAMLWIAGAPRESAGHDIKIPIIIDTDMALDDVGALALIAGSGHAEIEAIVTSDGSSSPRAGFENLLRILKFLEVPEISLGMGKSLGQVPPPWREHSEALGWARLPEAAPFKEPVPDAVSVITRVLSKTEENKITYVCLGPLTNLAEVLRINPSAKEQIGGILYSGTPPKAQNPDWNTLRDEKSAQAVFSSGLPIYTFSFKEADLLNFDLDFFREIQKCSSRSCRLIELLHRDNRIQERMKTGHLKVWDEVVALYLNDSSLWGMEPVQGKPSVFCLSKWDRKAARSAYLELAAGIEDQKLSPRIPVVLKQYPVNPADFRDDLSPLIPKIVAVHGIEEWKATLLTNELHRHLGIYSIFGAKMGIRAREILGASLDELRVESQAGLKPPMSCMNDGLQVATGASLGRGTIRVSEEKPAAAATFTFGQKRLHMRIKDDISKRIQADIKTIVKRFGALTPQYFEEVRNLSFRYWADMNRAQIFEEVLENIPEGT